MPPRFWTPPYKNQLLNIPQKEAVYSELPIVSSSDSNKLIQAAQSYWLAQSSTQGHLVCLPYDTKYHKKYNQKAPTVHVQASQITTFAVDRFDLYLASGDGSGTVAIHTLPTDIDFDAAPPSTLSPTPIATLTLPTRSPISHLSFHPTTSSLLLIASKSAVYVYDVSSEGGKGEEVRKIELLDDKAGGVVTSAEWSVDGKYIGTVGKDGVWTLWDARGDATSALLSHTIHTSPLKPASHIFLSSTQFLSTGFSKLREREYALFTFSSPDATTSEVTEVKRTRVDNSTSPLVPLVDKERNLVYLYGKGDLGVRWIEIGGPNAWTEGGSSLPNPIQSLTLCPETQMNLMGTEINRLLVVTDPGTVLPCSITVPRRQLIDFHSDLYPPVAVRVPAQSAKEWRKGSDKECEMVEQRPGNQARVVASRPVAAAPKSTVASPATPSRSAAPASVVASAAPVKKMEELKVREEKEVPKEEVPIAATPAKATTSPVTAATARSTPTPTPAPVFSAPITQPPASQAASSAPALPIGERFNPTWSRKFLSGKTPLKPDYHDLHGLSTTMHADVHLLRANSLYLFFPLGGPGGRLALHPVKAVGRFPTHIPAILSGPGIVNFELDPFDEKRVWIAGEDGKIRGFTVPESWSGEDDLSEADVVLSESKMDRISELRHHPTAKGLLLTISEDHGSPTVRLWDTASHSVLATVPLPAKGVSSAAWSPDGAHLAIATKSKTILLLDPRQPDAVATSPSHDSLRPVRLAWLDDKHLVSTGFSKAASRELILYACGSGKVAIHAKQTLDVSPAPLFPYIDPDTNILLLYSRGERSCHAYEVQPDDKNSPFGVLPSFENGTLQSGFAFLNKADVDIEKVEVLRAFRLTPATIEIVSFTIPRARVEFFQDDVYVPTRDVSHPTLTAKEWMDGKNTPQRLVDLRPPSMTLLSEAPMTAAKISTRSKIGGPVITDSQRQEAYMTKLFEAAKADGDEEEVVRNSHTPQQDDDDW